jgi:hypothetical protein
MLISRIHGSQRSKVAELRAAVPSMYSAASHSAMPKEPSGGRTVPAGYGWNVHVYQSLSRCHSRTQNIRMRMDSGTEP